MKTLYHALPVLLGVLLLVACTGPRAPSDIRLLDRGTPVEGLQGAYCWDSWLSDVCVDPMEPQFVPGTEHPLPADEPIQLQLDRPLPDTLTLSLSAELFGDEIVSDSLAPAEVVRWAPDVPPGTYVLNVDAGWRQGDVTYWFYIALN